MGLGILISGAVWLDRKATRNPAYETDINQISTNTCTLSTRIKFQLLICF